MQEAIKSTKCQNAINGEVRLLKTFVSSIYICKDSATQQLETLCTSFVNNPFCKCYFTTICQISTFLHIMEISQNEWAQNQT